MSAIAKLADGPYFRALLPIELVLICILNYLDMLTTVLALNLGNTEGFLTSIAWMALLGVPGWVMLKILASMFAVALVVFKHDDMREGRRLGYLISLVLTSAILAYFVLVVNGNLVIISLTEKN